VELAVAMVLVRLEQLILVEAVVVAQHLVQELPVVLVLL
jgi:hypothetical protein